MCDHPDGKTLLVSMSMLQVSAVIVTYRTGDRLRDCLYGLSADPEVSEIIIIDNGNPAEDEAWIDRFVAKTGKAKLTRTGENLGFGTAANIGAREAAGPLLLIINPDAVLRWKSVSAMVKASEGLPKPWLIGGRIFDINGVEERGLPSPQIDADARCVLVSLSVLMQWSLEKTPPPKGPVEMDAISGALFMMERDQFLGLDGGFDEAYFLHVEDIDLCRRVWNAGGRVIYAPDAAALHFGATADAPKINVERHKAAGLRYYFRKFARGLFGGFMAWSIGGLVSFALITRARFKS